MTRWSAVGVGLVVELLLGLVGLLVPGIGHLFAGLVGGFVAGYLCRSSVRSGLWHGLLAGGLGGLLIAAPLGLLAGWLVTYFGMTGLLGGLFTSLGVTGLVILVAVLMAIDSAIGGAIGVLLYRVLRQHDVDAERSARYIETTLGRDTGARPPEEGDEIRVKSTVHSTDDDH